MTAALIIAKHHLGHRLTVHSDGHPRDWERAARLCQSTLGYGVEFALDP